MRPRPSLITLTVLLAALTACSPATTPTPTPSPAPVSPPTPGPSPTPTPAPFQIIGPTAPVQLQPGSAVSFAVQISNAAGPVTLAVTNLPTGVNAVIAGTTVTLTASTGAPVSTQQVTVQATDGRESRTATFTLVVQAPSANQPDFTLTVTPASLVLNPGSSSTATITITPKNGFRASATLSVSNLPPSVSATIKGSTITFTATAGATAASGTVIVTAAGGGLTHTATINVVVQGRPADPDTTSPSITLASATTTVNAPGSVTFNAQAIDNVGVIRVALLRDGQQIGVKTATPYTFTDTFNDASMNGSHSYQAVAVDAAGNQGRSAAVTVTVAIPAPGADCAGGTPRSTPCTPDGVTALEQNILTAINEVRTKGTLSGDPSAVSGTCADPTTGGLGGRDGALAFEAHLHFAARKHSEYQAANTTLTDHENPGSPKFYGETQDDRASRASFAAAANSGGVTEALQQNGSVNAAFIVKTWLKDSVSCTILLDPSQTVAGVAVATSAVGETLPQYITFNAGRY